MNSRAAAMILCACVALSLEGCVAAVIPVAASGMIGRSRLRQKHRDPAPRRSPDTRVATPVDDAVTSGPIRPVPADVAAMESGTAYAGALPVPGGAKPTAASPPATVPAAPDERTNWSDVLHHVAAASEQRPRDSAIPTGTRGRWIPCADKPFAIVANLDAASVAGAVPYLRAIETLGLAIVYTSREPSAVVLRQAAALRKAGLEPPVAGQTLFPTTGGKDAATRATAGARYCVVSIVGTTARDFPDAVLPGAPDAHPGWFLIRGD